MADPVPPHGPAKRDVELVVAAMERRGTETLEFISTLSEDDDSELLDAVDRFMFGMRDLIVTEGESGADE